MEFICTDTSKKAQIKINQRGDEKNILFVDIDVSYDEPTVPTRIAVKFQIPCTDMYSVWSPSAGTSRYLNPNWAKRTNSSRLASGAPVQSLISASGNNRLTIAVSDAANPIDIRTGVIEENACVDCSVEFFTQPVSAIKDYHATVYLDFSDRKYYDSLYAVEKWWEDECGYKSAYIPDTARRPVYSCWYSFHQNIDVEAIVNECRIAKKYGMESVIIDDGWQTDDTNRGFSFCGDWEFTKTKIPDMKNFVDRVHETGMKFILWFSVPFVGKTTKAYARFSDMVLGAQKDGFGKEGWYCLDPRYKEVRDYLVGTYVRAQRDWGIDGFKLDFIDAFRFFLTTPEYDERRDIVSLEEAVDTLLSEITSALRKVNPEVLIEFRQTYIGPTIRKYGNMLRVADCPDDAVKNRVGSVDLRYSSGNTAVHSDMLMWHKDDPTESAALQLLDCFFTVPQISVRIEDITEAQRKMLGFYLDLWLENRETILDGKVTAENPESLYSIVKADKDGREVAVAYINKILSVENKLDYLAFINASGEDGLIIRALDDIGTGSYEIFDCTGKKISSGKIGKDNKKGLVEFDVPKSGVIIIK